MRWASICAGLLGGLSFVGVVRAEPGAPQVARPELPTASASFPEETHPVAPMRVDLTSTDAAPAPPVAPAPAAPAIPSQAPSADDASFCMQAPTALELAALTLVRMFEQGAGLLAMGSAVSPDEQAFDLAAAKELRRLTFMRQLAQMHEAENEREFSERLAVSMRKREFLQALETKQLAPNPFERQRH
jgi:hypothetical protein